jgi:23S rRNA (adenine2503-C2)-methyltransferase
MIDNFVSENNLPKFRLNQFNQHFFKEFIEDFDQLTSWPNALRQKLISEVDFFSLNKDKEFISNKKDTIKILFTRKVDKQRIETVLMRHQDGRNTVCVSCMVGCPVNCKFCATGKMGYGGSLSAIEIVDQVLYFQRYLKQFEQKVTNIVFMGMGEPMLNLKEVMGAIAMFTDSDKMAMSSRRITVSTSGYIPQLKQLIASGFRGRLAISLHAPNQELRAKLMPVAKIFNLDDLMNTLDEFVALTNKRVSYEYIMLKGVNDQEEHAIQLVKMFQKRLAHLNLIPYNPIAEEDFERSSKSDLAKFTNILKNHNINYTIRITMGDDVNAACGQLADRENKKHIAKKINI